MEKRIILEASINEKVVESGWRGRGSLSIRFIKFIYVRTLSENS